MAAQTQQAEMSPEDRKRFMAAVKPTVVKTNMKSTQKEAVAGIVHQAAVLASSYRELAAFIRIALTKLDGSIDWSVVVARSVFFQAKQRDRAAAVVSVPALVADLFLLAHGKLVTDVPTVVSEALASKRFQFSVMVFKCGSSMAEVAAEANMPPPPQPADVKWLTDAQLAVPVGHTVVRAQQAPLATITSGAAAGASAGAAAAAASAGSSSGSSAAHPAGDPVSDILRVVGGVQRAVGLNAASEGDFCRSLQAHLGRRYGDTWHVVLAGVPEGMSVTHTGAVMHTPAYDVTFDDRTPTVVHTAAGAPAAAASAASAGGAAASKRSGAATAPAPAAGEDEDDDDSGFAFRAGAGDVRLLEVALASHTPDAAPAATPAAAAAAGGDADAGAGAAAKPAAPAPRGKTPKQYTVCAFRTTRGYLTRLAENGDEDEDEEAAADQTAAGRAARAAIDPSTSAGRSRHRLSRLARMCSRGSSFTGSVRYLLYLVAAMCAAAYASMTIFGGGTACARDNQGVPFGPATLVLLASVLPPVVRQLAHADALLPPQHVQAQPWLGGTGIGLSFVEDGYEGDGGVAALTKHHQQAAAGEQEAEAAAASPAVSVDAAADAAAVVDEFGIDAAGGAGVADGAGAAVAAAGSTGGATSDGLWRRSDVKEGCSPTDTLQAELRSGQVTGLLYTGGAAIALLSLLRLVTNTYSKSRTQSLINSMARDRAAAAAAAAALGGDDTAVKAAEAAAVAAGVGRGGAAAGVGGSRAQRRAEARQRKKDEAKKRA